MKKTLIIIMLSFLAGLLFYPVRNMVTGKKNDWVEGHIQVSPNKKWAVLIQSTSTSILEESYCKISIFDTAQYPDLMKSGQFPTTMQENNPKASYLLPIQFYARAVNFEWAPDSNYVVLKQSSLNGNPPLVYRVDFNTFSLYEIEFQ